MPTSLRALLEAQAGLARSLLIYYAIPGRQRRLRRLYRRFIQPGDLCFDIGAHLGSRLRAWRALGANIVAVEPQPHLMAWLRRFYGRSPAVTLLAAAVAAEPGELALHVSRRHPTVTTLSAGWIERVRGEDSFANISWDERVLVPATTLDALIAAYGRPAFCKIDVEGFELEVLRGLSQPLPALSFEYLPAALDLARGCINRLGELGTYAYNWSAGESQRLAAPAWLAPEEMLAALPNAAAGGSGDIYACFTGNL